MKGASLGAVVSQSENTCVTTSELNWVCSKHQKIDSKTKNARA